MTNDLTPLALACISFWPMVVKLLEGWKDKKLYDESKSIMAHTPFSYLSLLCGYFPDGALRLPFAVISDKVMKEYGLNLEGMKKYWVNYIPKTQYSKQDCHEMFFYMHELKARIRLFIEQIDVVR